MRRQPRCCCHLIPASRISEISPQAEGWLRRSDLLAFCLPLAHPFVGLWFFPDRCLPEDVPQAESVMEKVNRWMSPGESFPACVVNLKIIPQTECYLMFPAPQQMVWEVACQNSYSPWMLSPAYWNSIEFPSWAMFEELFIPHRRFFIPSRVLSEVSTLPSRVVYVKVVISSADWDSLESPPVSIGEVLVRWFCYPCKSVGPKFLFPRSWWWILILSRVNISSRRSTVFLSPSEWRLSPEGRLLLYPL